MPIAHRALLPAAVAASGTAGAVVGGTLAAAKDIHRVNNGEMTRGQALADVSKEAAGTGLSTAAGIAVTGALGLTGLVGLVGIVGVATGTKYLWNKKFGFRAAPKSIQA